uniref:ADP-ribosylation factor GTPase-activating protein AGD12-like n=1 Tax=Nelumbo nucifera TaxID=4432 RepID=A0A822YJK4_NELNU|nr:TPA_asm: hypothetical protein HUJ06_011611 [Nelumbo nucifera]
MNNRFRDVGRPSPGNIRRLKELQLKSENRFCADCGAPDPKWASANIGVFICLKCCGAHRSLGTHISKVLSVALDEWSNDDIDAMVEVGGNSSANAIYEAFIPQGYFKPRPDSSHENVGNHRSKYELQEFLKPSLRIVSLPAATTRSTLRSTLSRKIIDTFRSSNTSTEMDGMKEFIGLLKVKVIKGTNLAIRDMLSSDPYVVLTLGKQKAQTQVINSNLNPIWNEELLLSVPQSCNAIKLEVFDYDTFSADDIMGDAVVDIQPLITAATSFGDASKFADMQIGKWLKSHDNALIDDSSINIIDGKVKQEMALKLQNVECGELELELEWLPLNN